MSWSEKESFKLYVSAQVDGREVLKPATWEDIARWLWLNDEAIPVSVNWFSGMQHTVNRVQQLVDAQRGIDKLAGGKP